MFTDIVGYSAMASHDEEEALRIVEINRNHQKPIIEKYGIYLKEMGDGVLARFSSAYDSIRCAQEIQESCPPPLKDKIRIGLHLGDVSESNGDIFGDGVNVASRLETKAEPGKIYLSDSVYHAIKGRSDVNAKYVGTFRLKNIREPVRTYTVVGKDEPVPTSFLKSKIWKSIRHVAIAIAVALAAIELIAYLVAAMEWDPGIVDVA
jgi:adenylate cyclase